MRTTVLAVFAVFFGCAIAGCSSRALTETCPTITSTGTSPHCIVAAQCVGTNTGVKLDCSGTDNNCVCYENDIAGQTVPFKNEFCDSSASKESTLEAANNACGWKL
jgi:hypothetical protein